MCRVLGRFVQPRRDPDLSAIMANMLSGRLRVSFPRPPQVVRALGDLIQAAINHEATTWRRPRMSPGAIGAEVATWAAVSPSLLPRKWWGTALNIFGNQMVGHTVGLAVGVGASRARRGLAQLLAGTPVGQFVPSQRAVDSARSGFNWSMTAITAAVWLRSVHNQRRIAELVHYDSDIGIAQHAAGSALGTGAYLLMQGFGDLNEFAYDSLTAALRRAKIPRWAAPIISGAIIGGALALATDRLLVRRIMTEISDKAAYANRLVFPGRSQPWEPERSGSPWSYEQWHAVGAQGRALLSDGPRARHIARVTGDPHAMEPIRVYAGLQPGRSLAEAADLVVRELHRTGAFRRDNLVLFTTTGTGWVQEWSLCALEFLSRGNCATAAMQYSRLQSFQAFVADQDAPIAAAKALFNRVYAEWQQLPQDNRPKLFVAGESLGSFGGQGAFSDAKDMLDKVDGAMWSGTPQNAKIWASLTDNRDTGSPVIQPAVDEGRHFRFVTSPADLWTNAAGQRYGEWEFPRVVFAQHPSDPIIWWDEKLWRKRPQWLQEPLGRDVLPTMRWFPFVTSWQLAVDALTSVDMTGGYGHNYHDEMISYWAAVMGMQFDNDFRGADGLRFSVISAWIRRFSLPR